MNTREVGASRKINDLLTIDNEEIKNLRTCQAETLIKNIKNKNKYSNEKLVQFIVYDLFQEPSVLKEIIDGWKSNQIDTKLFCEQIWIMPLRLKIIGKQSPIIRFFDSEGMSIPFRIVPRLVQASICALISRSEETAENIDNETKMYALGRKDNNSSSSSSSSSSISNNETMVVEGRGERFIKNVNYVCSEENEGLLNEQSMRKKINNFGNSPPFQHIETDKTNFCLVYSKFNLNSLLNSIFPRLEVTKCFIRTTINLSKTMRNSFHVNIANIIEILAVQQHENSADILISKDLLSINISTLRTLQSKIEKADFDLTQLDQIKLSDIKNQITSRQK